MTTEGLKPCPFCGGQARLKQHQKFQDSYYVQCHDCGVRTPYSMLYSNGNLETVKSYLTKQWNNRSGNDYNPSKYVDMYAKRGD